MDDVISKLRALLKQAGPNRKLVALVLVLTALIAFVINALAVSPSTIESKPATSETHQAIEPPSFYVHIVGQVKNPGVYLLTVGSRLFDAVVAAGGFLDSADQSSVNLARALTDGEQIFVLKTGESQSDYLPGQRSASGLISLNRASEVELEGLPGVGPALAGRIIDWRAANGGFKKKEDLLNVGGIGDKLFSGISKLVTL
jgi:competence protein ComEA